MEKNRSQEPAGGERKGLSIVIEGDNSRFVAEISSMIAKKLESKGKKLIGESSLRSPEENILTANQYLLDTTGAPMSPATLSLLVVIKLRERLKRVQNAKSDGQYSLSSSSWLGDAYYYESRGKSEVSRQIINDCGLMRPDVWIVIDEPHGLYARIAKQAGVRVYSPKLTKTKLVEAILEHIDYAEKKKPMVLKKEITKNALASIPEPKRQELSELGINEVLNMVPAMKFSAKMSQPVSYYRPEYLGQKVMGAYQTILHKILKNRQEVVEKLSGQQNNKIEVLRITEAMLPMAVISSVLMDHSMHSEAYLPEVRMLESKKASFKPASEEQTRLQKFIEETLSNNIDNQANTGVGLISYFPKNEMDLAVMIGYDQTDRSSESLTAELNLIPIVAKERIIKAYLEQPGRKLVLDRTEYTFEIVSDYLALKNIRRLTKTPVLVQEFTPRYGYEVPEIIEQHNQADVYEQAFDLSLELFSLLQAAGFPDEAQYAVLQGHRLRWTICLSANQVKKLIADKDPAFKELKDLIKEKVLEAHPLLWSK